MNFMRIGWLFIALSVATSSFGQGLSPLPPIRQNLPNISHKDFSSESNKHLAEKRINHIKGSLNLTAEQQSGWAVFSKILIDYETTQLNHSSEIALVRANNPADSLKISARHKREIAEKQEDVAHGLNRFLEILSETQKRKMISFLPKSLK